MHRYVGIWYYSRKDGISATFVRQGYTYEVPGRPCIQDHYNTVYGDTFQDPKNTLGYGAKSKAEKLKKAVRMTKTHVVHE